MLDAMVKLKDYVPLFQSILWFILIILVLIIYKNSIKQLLKVMITKIGKGASVKIGPIELGENIKELKYVDENSVTDIAIGADGNRREEHRRKIYTDNENYFLTHILLPVANAKEEYEIYIYIIGHKGKKCDDIVKAEFFFGHMWGNKIFVGDRSNGIIGVKTKAYGPFLCTCCIKLKSGKEVVLDRYIDFEMGKIVRNLTIAST